MRLRAIRLVVLLLLVSIVSMNARSDETDNSQRGAYQVGFRVQDFQVQSEAGPKTLTVAAWYPTTVPAHEYTYGGPTKGLVAVDAPPLANANGYPLLVYSHGYGGSGLAATFFNEALASYGWVVVAVDHHDRYSAVRIREGQVPFKRWEAYDYIKQIARSTPADRGPYLYRLDEIQQTLDWAIQQSPYKGSIDKDKIAVAGHSFGGYTVLGISGTIPQRHKSDIKAVLLFSSGAAGYLYSEAELQRIRMPVMYIYGEHERHKKRGEQTMLEIANKMYAAFAGDKYIIELKGAGHTAFNNRFSNRLGAWLMSGNEQEFAFLRRYGIAFLQYYVNQQPQFRPLLQTRDPQMTRFEYKLH